LIRSNPVLVGEGIERGLEDEESKNTSLKKNNVLKNMIRLTDHSKIKKLSKIG
jgi:hypothetical protein